MLKQIKKSVRLSLSDSSSYEKKEKKDAPKSASFSMRSLELTVKYMGYSPVSDARSLQTLKQAIRFIVQQHIRRTHSRFEMKNFYVSIYDLESDEIILSTPINKVALCGKEYIKGFEKCFAINVTTEDSHICHVMQASSTNEAEKFLIKIADAFDALGKMAKKSKQRKVSTVDPPSLHELAKGNYDGIPKSVSEGAHLNKDHQSPAGGYFKKANSAPGSTAKIQQSNSPSPASANSGTGMKGFFDRRHHSSADESSEMQERPLPPVPYRGKSITEKDPFVSLKNTKKEINSDEEDPYSTIKRRQNDEEDPYSTVKEIRKSQAIEQSKVEDEDPYSTIQTKQLNSKDTSNIDSSIVIRISGPNTDEAPTKSIDDQDTSTTIINSDDQEKEESSTTSSHRHAADVAKFKANLLKDLYEERKAYQSRRSIANKWTSYNVSEVYKEVGGEDGNQDIFKKEYDPTDIYDKLHKCRMQNSKAKSSDGHSNEESRNEHHREESEQLQQVDEQNLDNSNVAKQDKFYQSVRDVQSTYAELRTKIKSKLSKSQSDDLSHLVPREAIRRVVSEIYKYDYRLDNSKILKEIIQQTSINIDSIDPETGYSLLHHSVSSENISSVKFFLDRGANVNLLNQDRSTPLHCAVTTGNHQLVKLLLCKGADVTIKDAQGRTALHLVTGLRQDRDMMLLLVEYGGRVNEADLSGTRPVDIQQELSNIQKEMILKYNDELCSIDVGALFRYRSRVNSRGSFGANHKTNENTATSDAKNPAPNELTISDSLNNNFSITKHLESAVAPLNSIHSENKEMSDLSSDIATKHHDVQQKYCSDDICGHDNEETINRNNTDISGNPLDTLLEYGSPDSQDSLQDLQIDFEINDFNFVDDNLRIESDSRSAASSISNTSNDKDNDKTNVADITVEINQDVDQTTTAETNPIVSDMGAWEEVFYEINAWADVFTETEEQSEQQTSVVKDNTNQDELTKLRVTPLTEASEVPTAILPEEIINNKNLTNADLVRSITTKNKIVEDELVEAVCPGDPAEIEIDLNLVNEQEETAVKCLRGLAILAKNPECHPTILSVLFASNTMLKKLKPDCTSRTLSVQLAALAHTECSLKSLHQYLASLIFMLFNADGISSKKKSINGGLVNLLSDLVDSNDECIKKTSLSLLWELLHINSDREFCTTMSHFHIDPMLDLIVEYETNGHLYYDQFNPNNIDDMYRQYVLQSHTIKHNEIISMASKILARASIYGKVRNRLSEAKAIAVLCTSHALLAPKESYLLGCTIANIAMDDDKHGLLQQYKIPYALKPLLSSKNRLMQYHAARGLVYMGYCELNISIFSDDYEDLIGKVLYSSEPNSEQYIRGTTLEKIIVIMTENPSMLWDETTKLRSQTCDSREQNSETNGDDKLSRSRTSEQIVEFLLTMYKSFTNSKVLMNLFLHRFRHPSVSRIFGWDIKSTCTISSADENDPIATYSPLPLVHVYLMRIWETWLQQFADDFITNYDTAIALSKLIQPMRAVGGPYKLSAARLEELLGNIKAHKDSPIMFNQLKSNEASHDKLFEKCTFDIIGGMQPCTMEDAAKLASIQLYIEDITGHVEETHENHSLNFLKPKKQILINHPDQDLVVSRVSSSRIRSCLPEPFTKSRHITKTVKDLHEVLCAEKPSERNAKHQYIDYCQSLSTYGSCIFNFEEVSVISSAKSKRPKAEYEKKILCIHPRHVIILDSKTKESNAYYNFQNLKRWEPGNFGNLTTMQLSFTNKTHTFVLDNIHQWQEINEIIWACIEELDWQHINKMSKTPWSKLAEETRTWGRAAAAAHARTPTVKAAARLSSSTATEEDLENFQNITEIRTKSVSQTNSLTSVGSSSVQVRQNNARKISPAHRSSLLNSKEREDNIKSLPLARKSYPEYENPNMKPPPSNTPKWRMKQVWALSQALPTHKQRQSSIDSRQSDGSIEDGWILVDKNSSSSESLHSPSTPTDDQALRQRRNHPSSSDNRTKRYQFNRSSPTQIHKDSKGNHIKKTSDTSHDSSTFARSMSQDNMKSTIESNSDSCRPNPFTSSPKDSFMDVSDVTDETDTHEISMTRSISRVSTCSSLTDNNTMTEKKIIRNATFDSLDNEAAYGASYKSTDSTSINQEMFKPAGVKSIESYGMILNVPKCSCPPDPDLSNIDLNDLTVVDLLRYPKELAKQITLIDHELFRQVTVADCQKKFASGSKKKVQLEDSNPIQSFAQRFNMLSHWVTASILEEKDIELRAYIFSQFINTAKHCLQLGNYNAVMAIIIAGLGSSYIRRLEKTKALLSKETLLEYDNLETLMDPKNNYKEYRDALKEATTPAVPYFGIYLKDLTFISDGNSDYLRDGLINITKRRFVYMVLEDMRRFQKEKYNFRQVNQIHNFLCNVQMPTQDDLHKKSIKLEFSA